MKRRIISNLDKNIIVLSDIEDNAYIGIENNTPGNPFKRGFLAQYDDNKFKMFFNGWNSINTVKNNIVFSHIENTETIENIINHYQNDKNIIFYHFDTAKELYEWLANE